MRLMLGIDPVPELLVEVKKQRSSTDFDFWVVNGAWDGVFKDGDVTVNRYDASRVYSGFAILCDNQDRLRGDYKDVFYHFHNPDYIAPKPKKIVDHSRWDDEIPF